MMFQHRYNLLSFKLILLNFSERRIGVARFKLYFLIFACLVISIAFSGCGTIKGIGNDISVIGGILNRV